MNSEYHIKNKLLKINTNTVGTKKLVPVPKLVPIKYL